MGFANLPYYSDADVMLSQSGAILRHVGRKHGLLGADAHAAAKVNSYTRRGGAFYHHFHYDSPRFPTTPADPIYF